MVDIRALKETLQDLPQGGAGRKIKRSVDAVKKVVKSEAFKDTVKDIPRVADEVEAKMIDNLKRSEKYIKNKITGGKKKTVDASKKDKKDKKSKRQTNKEYRDAWEKEHPKYKLMKTGGPVKKCRVDGIAAKGFTKAYSLKKGK